MNEQLQEALSELLNKANNGIDSASDFLASELPDVIYQLLMWHGVYSLVLFTFGLFLLLSVPYQIKKINSFIPEKIKEGDNDNWFWKDGNGSYSSFGFYLERTEGAFFFYLAAFIFSIVEFAFILNFINLTWLQIWIAPKVWLLEYAAKLAG